MILFEKNLVVTSAPETHRLHRVAFDTEIYFTAATLLDGETEADFEEVSEWPHDDDETINDDEL